MQIAIVAPNPDWPAAFTIEAACLREVLQPNISAIHHIGSTAIHGLAAKPIIDVLLVSPSLLMLDEFTPVMVSLGYEVMGEYGIPERRYFRKSAADGRRTHHIHAFQIGSSHIERYLSFRNYLNEHPSIAQSYGALKQRLATVHSEDRHAYMNGKAAFIKEHEDKALAWMRGQPS